MAPASLPRFDDGFWRHWGDGQAEVNAYDLTFPRYGAARSGLAVSIFVTETLQYEQRVKSNSHTCCTDKELPVMKLNLVHDFPTGIYDYNLMTSSWIALSPYRHYQPGAPVKVSFSAQEWCGQVYHQVLFDKARIASTSHSYFEDEADKAETMDAKEGGLSEDTLAMWARGLSGPLLGAGQQARVPVLRSLGTVRLQHVPLQWGEAVLKREASSRSVTVPAGSFEVDVLVAQLPDHTITYYVERAQPRRIIQWTSTRGEEGRLLGSKRLRYWEMNGVGGEEVLRQLGVTPRAPRMP